MAIEINGTTGISGVDGSATTPALQGQDTNTGISFGTDEVNVVTGGTTRATFDSAGAFRVSDGTAALPSVTFSGDVNTGLYRPAADILAFSTAGSERFRVGSAGQLGIGGATYGTDGQVLTSTGATTAPAWEDLPAGASWTTASVNAGPTGGVVDLTSLPSDIDFFVFSWNNVNSTANAEYFVRLGHSTGFQTTGYQVSSGYWQEVDTNRITRYTDSFYIRGSGSGGNTFGRMWFSRHGTGNNWHATGTMNTDSDNVVWHVNGMVALGGTLDRIRLQMSSGGLDTQGSVCIQYLRT